VDVVEGDTGIFSVRIKKQDGTGHEVSTKDGSVFMSVSELIETIKVQPEYGFAFDGSKASGGGQEPKTPLDGKPSATAFDARNVRSKGDLKSSADKSAYLTSLTEKHGGDIKKAQEEYFALPEATA
jgi:hypothetical protein